MIGSPVSIKPCDSEAHGNLPQHRADKTRSLETYDHWLNILFFERLRNKYFSILLKAYRLTSQNPSRCTEVKEKIVLTKWTVLSWLRLWRFVLKAAILSRTHLQCTVFSMTSRLLWEDDIVTYFVTVIFLVKVIITAAIITHEKHRRITELLVVLLCRKGRVFTSTTFNLIRYATGGLWEPREVNSNAHFRYSKPF